jgi:biopolymer transport protein ExbB
MNQNVVHVWTTLTPLGVGFAMVLVVMAISVVGVTIGRLLVLSRSAEQSRTFAALAGKLVDERQFEEVVQLAGKCHASALASVFGPIVSRYLNALGEPEAGGLSPVALARNESARRLVSVDEELRRGVSVIAIIGRIAPLVGVLGTVLGMIAAAQNIDSAASAGVGPVMLAVAGALVVTVFGLAVAIPALIACYYLNTRISAINSALSRSAGELLDELEAHFSRRGISQRRAA